MCYFHAHHFFGFLHHAPASTLFNNLFLIHISYSHASTLPSHEFIFFLAVQSKLFKSTLSTGGVQNRTIATTMRSGHFSARSLYYHKGVATGLSYCCRHLAQEGELCPLGSTTSPRDLLPAFPVRWILFPFYLTHSKVFVYLPTPNCAYRCTGPTGSSTADATPASQHGQHLF